MNIAIVVAMQKEATELVNIIEDPKNHQVGDLVVVEGTIEQHTVFVTVCGIGKAFAAAATQLLIDKVKPTVVLNIGVASSCVDDIAKGEIVCGTTFKYHDFDYLSAERLEQKLPIAMADKRVLKLAKEACRLLSLRCIEGNIASGDNFVTTDFNRDLVKSKTDCICVDTCSAAIALISSRNGVPFGAIKIISDFANGDTIEDISVSLNKYRYFAGQIVAEMLKYIK